VLREHIGKYIRARKSGERKTKVQGESDILTLLLQSPDIFTEEHIIDEVIDFFTAGMLTSSLNT
jgi:cytochrome P450